MARCLCLLTSLLLGAAALSADTLSVRRYRVPEGLAHNSVRVIRQDAKGYLWLGTGEGVSRFDGYRFVNYSTGEGLTVPLVNDILEDAEGRIWVATNGAGLALFLDQPASVNGAGDGRARPFFRTFRLESDGNSNQINALAATGAVIWCATDGGLFRTDLSVSGEPSFTRVGPIVAIDAMTTTTDGRVLVASARGVSVRHGDSVVEFGPPPHDRSEVQDVAARDGGWFVLTARGLHFVNPSGPGGRAAWTQVPLPVKPGERHAALHVDASGTLWIGSTAGLFQLKDGVVTQPAGLAQVTNAVQAFHEDRNGHMWLGTELDGLAMLSRRLFTSFDTTHGLPEADIVSVTEGANGDIVAASRARGWIRMVGDRPERIPGTDIAPFSGVGNRIVCDRDACWTLTSAGLYQLDTAGRPGSANLVFAVPTGHTFVSISGRAENGLYRDPSGVLWFATTEPALYRAPLAAPAGSPVTRVALPSDPMAPVALDRTGVTWLASMSALGRFKDGRVEVLRPDDTGTFDPRTAFVDSRGWLWVGLRYGGVAVTQDPGASRPAWTRYSTATGLASNSVWGITEDRGGRMYFATNRGVNRFDPANDELSHYTTADGLAGDVVSGCLTDRRGRVWLATSGGLSRFDPAETTARRAPVSTYINAVDVADQAIALPESGTAHVAGLQLVPGGNRLSIQFAGVSVGAERELRYQYQLEGAGGTWSSPTLNRVVTYAGLGAGDYRFLVRATDANATLAGAPAIVEFRVLPPIWQRWWFIGAALLVTGAGAAGIQRQRVRRRRADEALRRQVARDLHDDVGAGLSQIAIMSEVLHRQTPEASGLTEIARVARSLREAMSDIVWAVGPNTDRPGDLVNRMRQAAFTLLDFEGLRVHFETPAKAELDRLELAPKVRRHLLLIFKEAVTNVARHARASELTVTIAIERRDLTLTIRDDGIGFDLNASQRGQGLDNLAHRAEAIGAALTVDSSPGAGTRIRVCLPLT
jgi:signal transduction histidine kinase/ligand-binding sensor domain-containing protein